MRMKSYLSLAALTILSALFSLQCTFEDEDPAPDNPFENIDTPAPEEEQPDSNTIVGLHKFIFSQSCDVPGCHDGTFEPDFRTVESTYNTLLYQPILKNDPERDFRYRVKPFDADASWLHEKLITEDPIISRMPSNGNPLSATEIRAVREWINNGARDMYGNVPELPDPSPVIYGVAAFAHYQGVEFRLDTIRETATTTPFVVVKAFEGAGITQTDLWIGVIDQGEDSTAIEDFTDNRLLVSDKIDDFSQARTYQAEYMPEGKVVSPFLQYSQAGFYWRVRINPQDYEVGKVYYFRYHVNDGKEKSREIPNFNSPYEAKTYMAFVVVE